MKIALASKSKTKEAVVVNSISKLFPGSTPIIKSFNFEDQGAEPVGEEALLEQIINSINKMKVEDSTADYFVAMEGGVRETVNGMEEISCVIIEDKGGRRSMSWGVTFPIPEVVAAKVREGAPLATAVDTTYSTDDIKHNGGFVSLLTNDAVNKMDLYFQPTVVALSKFLKKDWF
ncbi:MAG: DUF84 family protein [bacterium]